MEALVAQERILDCKTQGVCMVTYDEKNTFEHVSCRKEERAALAFCPIGGEYANALLDMLFKSVVDRALKWSTELRQFFIQPSRSHPCVIFSKLFYALKISLNNTKKETRRTPVWCITLGTDDLPLFALVDSQFITILTSCEHTNNTYGPKKCHCMSAW